MEIPGSFGEWLKQRRRSLDLTQEELAERAGCSIFALRKIETGERRPSKQLAGLLAAALEIPQDDKLTFIRVARGDLILERLRASRPGSKPAPFSPSIGSGQRPQPAPHHLPLPPTPLLGRDPELAAMERIFFEPQCRLLTLTGMGGIGKTRLALEFASRQREAFPDGVHYVPLASIDSPDLIVPAIAEALELSFSGPTDLQRQLFNHLASALKHPALLVLDNLEQLLAHSSAAAELVADMLQRFSNIKILCTSRERLSLHGEWTYELHGLSIPTSEYVDRLEDYSAPVLFLQRARQINAEFELTASEKTALIRICRLVEGIPLALELAAAWVGMLSCREIAQEIESNIGFLSTSMRDIPERHRSLKATFDHSWRLLSDAEQDLLSRLSVCHGGFDRSAAERIAGATLPLLSSIVSKSLVRRAEGGRYDLHEVIRQYALSQLNEDESQSDAARDRHCEYFLKFVADREKDLKSAGQQEAMRELTREMDNIRVAWVWGIERGKFELLAASVRCLGWMFEVGGLIREGIEQLELLIQTLRADLPDRLSERALGAALIQQGLLNFRTGQFVHAVQLYKEGISILRTVDEPALLCDALIFSGTITHLNGDYLQAKQLIEEGLRYAHAAHDRWFAAYGIYNLGHVESLMGDYETGYEQMNEGIRLWRELGDPHSISLGLNFLVETQIKLDRLAEATAAMRESISLCEQTKNRWGLGTAYRYLGLVTLASGDLMEAQLHFEKSLEVFGEYFQGWDIATTLIYLGEAKDRAGEDSEARRHLLEALRLARGIHSRPLMLDAVTALSSLEKCRNPGATADRLALVISHPAATRDTRDRACRILSDIRIDTDQQRPQAVQGKPLDQILEELADRILE